MGAPCALVGDTLTPTGRIRAAVVVQDGKIMEVIEKPREGDLPRENRYVSGLICAGFIDLQINGGFGHDVGPDRQALKSLARELPRTGVTSFLPTAISWPVDRYEALFEALGAWDHDAGARILGVHLEGPFLTSARKGDHDGTNVRSRSVDTGLLDLLIESRQVRIMTLAPELPGAPVAIQRLLEAGMVPSAGHTEATYEQMVTVFEMGLRLGTHLYNAMSPLEHRAPGVVGALLSCECARVGIIFDGVHVHQGALRLAYRMKGPRGLALVTDAMEAAGMLEGSYKLSGRMVELKNGEVRLPDGTLAGSALTLDVAVRNATKLLNITTEDAVRMATETPADILSLPEKGRIVAGADADFAVLDADGAVGETIVAGKTVYPG